MKNNKIIFIIIFISITLGIIASTLIHLRSQISVSTIPVTSIIQATSTSSTITHYKDQYHGVEFDYDTQYIKTKSQGYGYSPNLVWKTKGGYTDIGLAMTIRFDESAEIYNSSPDFLGYLKIDNEKFGDNDWQVYKSHNNPEFESKFSKTTTYLLHQHGVTVTITITDDTKLQEKNVWNLILSSLRITDDSDRFDHLLGNVHVGDKFGNLVVTSIKATSSAVTDSYTEYTSAANSAEDAGKYTDIDLAGEYQVSGTLYNLDEPNANLGYIDDEYLCVDTISNNSNIATIQAIAYLRKYIYNMSDEEVVKESDPVCFALKDAQKFLHLPNNVLHPADGVLKDKGIHVNAEINNPTLRIFAYSYKIIPKLKKITIIR